MSSHLTLFAQVPLHSKFTFGDSPIDGKPKVFIKTSDEGAHHDGAFHPVNPGVLVFPILNPIIVAEFTLSSGDRFIALELGDGWELVSITDSKFVQRFNSLEDIINHLGS